jgi:hypothetical protein
MNKAATVTNSIWGTDCHCDWILFLIYSWTTCILMMNHMLSVVLTGHSIKNFAMNFLGFIIPSTTSSKQLWNTGQLLPHYTALHPRRQPPAYSLSCELYWECSAVTTCILKISIERYAVSWSSSHFTTRQKGPSIQCIWEWMGPWTILDVVRR